MSSPRGRFITLEGGEGSGKSTQAKRLAERLRSHGLDVVLTREPGGSPGAEAVRAALLGGAVKPYGSDVEALLFAAARADHVDRTIAPALARGQWVICDRFIDSTRVYQGAVGQVEAPLLNALEQVAIGPARPDLTLLLDISSEAGLARAAARAQGQVGDRFEREGMAFHQAVRTAFLELAGADPERCVVVDAGRQPDMVAIDIAKAVRARFPEALSETVPA
ncbi:dTMP kinase [Aquabacter cavernae]|uniref:dTMP kinase n=1 Tax=Aquabacter cavernae TaxID=2496029 RepID=UPI000F8E2197|nr:dTMP kinase [Aquabacter cavernae]